MKKVVNGRVYDTDTASTVLNWTESRCVAELQVTVQYRLKRMYQLKEGVSPEDAVKPNSYGSGISIDPDKIDRTRGEFFLSIETNGWDEGAKVITPISDNEARMLVEKRGSFDEYVKWFGDPRGPVLTPDTVRKAVDAAQARVRELEAELESMKSELPV